MIQYLIKMKNQIFVNALAKFGVSIDTFLDNFRMIDSDKRKNSLTITSENKKSFKEDFQNLNIDQLHLFQNYKIKTNKQKVIQFIFFIIFNCTFIIICGFATQGTLTKSYLKNKGDYYLLLI